MRRILAFQVLPLVADFTEKVLRVDALQVFAHLSTPNEAAYRAVLAMFVKAKKRLLFSYRLARSCRAYHRFPTRLATIPKLGFVRSSHGFIVSIPRPSAVRSRERINLALGGGGAKGIVHVGALEALHDLGFEIATVTGTSVGAIVGGLFAYYRTVHGEAYSDPMEAQGRAVRAVRTLFEQTVLVSFRDITLAALWRGRLLAGAKIFRWLDTALLNRTTGHAFLLGDLEIPLLITAVNAENGESIKFTNDGLEEQLVPMSLLIRASAAIPGVFPEVNVPLASRTVKCWDGGVCGNCRFDLAAKLMPELRTVAVSVTYSGKHVNPTPSWSDRVRALPTRILYGMSPEIDHCMSILMKACEDNAFNILTEATQSRIVRIFPDFGDISTLAFNLNRSKKQALFAFGRIAVMNKLGEEH